MDSAAFVRMGPSGPDGRGLQRRPPYPREGLETEPPVHASHLYVDDPERGIRIGTWESTPHTGRMQPFPVNEFMILLEGAVTILEEDGRSSTFRAGEAFLIPKGRVCQWRQTGHVRKHFAIDGGGPGPGPVRGPVEAPSVLRVSLAAEAAEVGRGRVLFTDATGRYALATRSGSDREEPADSGSHRLVHVLRGSLTLSDENGPEETVGAGETALILSPGTVRWRAGEGLRILSCAMIRAARGGARQAAAG